MRIVSNASPLILLTKIDSLGLLQQCFQQTLVPPCVVAEVGMDLPRFIAQTPLSDLGEAYVKGAIGNLHRGELEALVLAREQQVDLIALDDRSARQRAAKMGLRPIGTIGLLALFRSRGLMDAATAIDKLEALVEQHGLYLSERLLDEARQMLADAACDRRGAER